ncbi:phosphate signaling complex protein PhoU [bacterium]|jgi:phosphate transport system protein|nr:phosphate signaling complex protein PhoU [Verrucomicrobiota bacterium]MDA7645074.1 phosphate signaling complex protein PhoU [bacterium]MDA7680433.1 phosphate signaling complex protein PhoU [bacterium]
MTQHFHNELIQLNDLLLTMASRAETAVRVATRALIERDDDLAMRVEATDQEIDQFEIEIDELAIQLLAKAPLAKDLRLITVAMKICTDLERVGDEATTIARRALELSQEPQLKDYSDIPRMVTMAMAMMDQALKAFVNEDTDSARAVIPQDKAVDRLNKQIHRELSDLMIENPSHITRCLNLMVISKSIERIADHAKNIAEVVVYLCEATDIRHNTAAVSDAQRSENDI